MKLENVVLCALLVGAVAGKAEDLETLTGKTYCNIQVQDVLWDSLLVKHDNGITKVFYAEIPADRREHYKQLAPAPATRDVQPPEPPDDLGGHDLFTLHGDLYRDVKVKRVDVDSVHITHASGLAKIAFSEIPEGQREQYRMPASDDSGAPPGTNDMATLDGRIYRNVQVRTIEPDGLTIEHDAGLTKVLFPNMPQEVQEKFEYDPTKAAHYRKSRTFEARQASQRQQAIREQNEKSRRKTIQAEPIRIFDVCAFKEGKFGYRIRFSVRNYDDKPREITAMAWPLANKKVTIPARSSRAGIELVGSYNLPESFSVTSGNYRTNTVVHW